MEKFYWIKLKTDFFDDNCIDWLQDQKNGCEYIVLYLRLCLMTANTNGVLQRQVGEMIIPYEPRKIAEITHISIDTVLVAMELFKKIGLMCDRPDGTVALPSVPSMVGTESANKAAIRQRRHREKKRLEKETVKQVTGNVIDTVTESVTKCHGKRNASVTDCLTEIRDKRLENRDKSKENREEKVESRKKETGTSDDGLKDAVNAYRKNIYPMPGEMDLEKLKALVDDFGSDTVIKAIDRAVTRNKRSLAYIHGILKSWQAGGYDDENTALPQPTPRNSKKEAIDTVNRLMAEYKAKEGEEKDDNGSIDPASDWSFATGVQK